MAIEVTYLLACYGLTFAVCDASVFDWPRQKIRVRLAFADSLLSCYFCTGFWVSLVWYVLLLSGLVDGHAEARALAVSAVWGLAHAFAGASFVYALNAAVVALEAIWAARVLTGKEEPQDGP